MTRGTAAWHLSPLPSSANCSRQTKGGGDGPLMMNAAVNLLRPGFPGVPGRSRLLTAPSPVIQRVDEESPVVDEI
jgi:hypothetical protein